MQTPLYCWIFQIIHENSTDYYYIFIYQRSSELLSYYTAIPHYNLQDISKNYFNFVLQKGMANVYTNNFF